MPAKKKSAKTTAEDPETRQDAIQRRAYEISQSEHAGTPEENWHRAERELAGESSAD